MRVLALLAALALVAAACSNQEGDDDTATTEAAPDTTAAAETTTTTEAEETTTTAAATETTEADSGADLALGVGVTEEPCPDGNPDRGCIYMGVLTDESGPFAPAAPALVGGQRAFWAAANAAGGIGGQFDVALPDDLKQDTSYDPTVLVQSYNDIAGDVAAIAQSLGTPQTVAALADYERDSTVAAPMSWWSGWGFESADNGHVVEFGTSYCLEAMNAVDWSMEALPAAGREAPSTIGILAFPNDYGADYAAGVKIAAEANGIEVAWEAPVIPVSFGGDPEQVEAIQQVVNNPVDVVYLVTGSQETAPIVASSAAQGATNLFIGAGPSWNVGILGTAAAPAFEAGIYFQSSYVGPWDYDSVGHEKMRQTLGAIGVDANDFFVAGWVSQYGLKAALEIALESGDLTHEGILAAAQGLTDVDYEGMMPSRSFAGDPADVFPRQSVVGGVDTSASTGIAVVQDFFVGPTAEAYDYSEPCSAAN
jgi:ABC-type branched-subunit amino acid transport system substrate-binding protein